MFSNKNGSFEIQDCLNELGPASVNALGGMSTKCYGIKSSPLEIMCIYHSEQRMRASPLHISREANLRALDWLAAGWAAIDQSRAGNGRLR